MISIFKAYYDIYEFNGELLKRCIFLDEVIGFSITWADTNIGGQVLFFPNFEFSFSITINIKNFDKDIVDDNWYLIKLLPIFDKNGILYNSIRYQEYR